jgi:hypothetical protein
MRAFPGSTGKYRTRETEEHRSRIRVLSRNSSARAGLKGEMEDEMKRVIAAVLLTLALAGCVYDGGGGYPRTLGPQGDTSGATGS